MGLPSCHHVAASLLAAALLLLVWAPLGSAEDVFSGTADGSEQWGYMDVRPGAHMFWWLYNSPEAAPGELTGEAEATTPLIMWLQGGPGASGAGYGNFEEIGPLTTALKPRPFTWLKAAHLLFVDNPVGTGFSYVDDKSLLVKTNHEAVVDLVNFLRAFMHFHQPLRRAPFFVFCESYGGKYTSELAVAIHKALSGRSLELNFKGVAMGDSWISPIDFMKVWGSQLRTLALIDDDEEEIVNGLASQAEDAITLGQWDNATALWATQEAVIDAFTDDVDFYNFLRHHTDADAAAASKFLTRIAARFGRRPPETPASVLQLPSSRPRRLGAGGPGARQLSREESLYRLAGRHLARRHNDLLDSTMNGPIREKLGIIPPNVTWGFSAGDVFAALYTDFMRPTVEQVDELLALGVNVTIYSGQLDIICCTDGTENWMKSLRWPKLQAFQKARRTPLYPNAGSRATGAFVKRHANLAFFWVMAAGHMVPQDNPAMALQMVRMVTGQA